MTTITAPADLIQRARDLAPAVRAAADETERGRRVPQHLLQLLIDARLFDIVLPQSLGGLEVDILTMMRIIEEISIADGATGWTVGIGAGTSILAAFLAEDVARAIYTPGTITGGPVAPMGRATPVDGGYRVTGRWPFASGSEHCAWLAAGSLVFDGDAPRMIANGIPDWRMMLFPAADIEIIDTWNVSGLRGTGSHDIAVKDAFVPAERSIGLGVDAPNHAGPLYRFPIFAFLAMSIATVGTGIARRAIDDFITLAQTKRSTGASVPLRERATVQSEVAQAEATLRSARAFLYETVAEVWEHIVAGNSATIEQRALMRLAAAHATISSARAVDMMYTLGGGSAIYETSTLQREFRDIHTATQHVILNAANYELTGQILLGLKPTTLAL